MLQAAILTPHLEPNKEMTIFRMFWRVGSSRNAVALLAAIFLLSATARAQSGTVTGAVTDAVTGRSLEGATLSIVSGTNIRSTGTGDIATYTLRGFFPVQGITGLWLRAHPFDYSATDALPATLGHSDNGNFVLSEIRVTADPY